MWPITLSGRLSIDALVSRYLTNKLMERRPILRREVLRSPALTIHPCEYIATCGIIPALAKLFHTWGQVAYVLLTRSPLK